MTKPNIADAIKSLRPNYNWTINGDEYEGIIWISPDGKPSKSEVLDELNRLITEYDAANYQRQRKAEYIALEDQLDMIYWDKVNGTNNWQNHINTIKSKYPKT